MESFLLRSSDENHEDSSISIGLLAFITCISHSAYSTVPVTKNKLYAGVFTGISSSNKISNSQYVTSFIPEGSGGSLAVNAFGQ